MIWCCPLCHGALSETPTEVTCQDCGTAFPVVAEIPDFRCDQPAWVDFETDRLRAKEIDAHILTHGLADAMRRVFLESRDLNEAKSEYRVKQVLAGIEKCDAQLDGWLHGLSYDTALEIGSGPGQLLAAGARRGQSIHGLDVSLEWLVVAKHWVRSLGGDPKLAGGLAERLPLRSGSVDTVVGLDVLEHVGDQKACLAEISRVLKKGGRFALVTPNRFSLSPEPHVGVWGVGYLPVRFQAAWVGLFTTRSYAYTRLLSVGEIRRLVRQTLGADPTIIFPPIADEEIALFSPFKARLAWLYNKLVRHRIAQTVMPFIGAYYRVFGTKPGQVGAPAASGVPTTPSGPST